MRPRLGERGGPAGSHPALDASLGREPRRLHPCRDGPGRGDPRRGGRRSGDATVPFVVIDHQRQHARTHGRLGPGLHKVVEEPVFETNILHINADVLPTALTQLPADLPAVAATSALDLGATGVPRRAGDGSFGLVDEVWVPSTFVRDADRRRLAGARPRGAPRGARGRPGHSSVASTSGCRPTPSSSWPCMTPKACRSAKNPQGALEAF